MGVYTFSVFYMVTTILSEKIFKKNSKKTKSEKTHFSVFYRILSLL